MEVVMAKQIVSKHLLVTPIFVFFSISVCVGVGPEQGIFTRNIPITEDTTTYYEGFTKSMYINSSVSLQVTDCEGGPYHISWMIRFTECEGVYQILDQNGTEDSLATIFQQPTSTFDGETFIMYYQSKEQEVQCESDHFKPLQDDFYMKWITHRVDEPTDAPAQADEGKNDGIEDVGDAKNNAKRGAIDTENTEKGTGEKDTGEKATGEKATGEKDTGEKGTGEKGTGEKATGEKATGEKGTGEKGTGEKGTNESGASGKQGDTGAKAIKDTDDKNASTYEVVKTKRDGRHLFIVKIEPIGKPNEKEDVLPYLSIKVAMKSPKGYLSAFQWPLLPFYGVMCAVYSILAFIWLLLLGCNWRDLLRIQFWICGVIVLGLLEKAIFYAEYEHLNKEGISVTGAIIFAELISCLKRALARMLLIIVSLGYGITRPRLGKDLHWVMAAGATYFVLSSVEGCLRVKGNEQHALIAVLPLAVLDAVICWWIFKNLVDTTRQLRLRRNLTKLWLYRHLTNALIVCIVCAVVFLVWSTKAHRWTSCVTKWRELWLDDAYWHVLFCIILVVIMVLIRPTANNQRYAFSPLVDAVDDEESQQPMINDAFDSVKMRQMPGEKTSSGKSPAEDALKWVEDNIPAAVADAALGAFDDSEEELVNTLERNKME